MKRLAILAVLLGACSDVDSTRKTLEGEGYTNIVTTGYSAWSCGHGDDTCTGFEATHPISGKRIKGAVGCGWTGCSKGCTVRVKP